MASEFEPWLSICGMVVGSLVAAMFAALFRDEIHQCITSVLCLPNDSVHLVRRRASAQNLRLWRWVGNRNGEETDGERGSSLYPIIGSLLYTCSFVFFVIAEWTIAHGNWAFIGLEKSDIKLPLGAADLAALVMVVSGFFFGCVGFEMLERPVTRLGPLHRVLKPKMRKLMLIVSIVMCLISASISSALMLYRAESIKRSMILEMAMASEEAVPVTAGLPGDRADEGSMVVFTEKDFAIISYALFAVACMPILGSAVSAVGIGLSLKAIIMLTAAIICIVASPFILLLRLVEINLAAIAVILITFLDLMAAIGRRLLGFFGGRRASDETVSPPPTETGNELVPEAREQDGAAPDGQRSDHATNAEIDYQQNPTPHGRKELQGMSSSGFTPFQKKESRK